MIGVSLVTFEGGNGDEPPRGLMPIDELFGLLEASSRAELFEWAVNRLGDQLDAEMVKLAEARDGLLIPTACTPGGGTGREHAIDIATSLPGSIYISGDGCVVEDLADLRSSAAPSDGQNRGSRPASPGLEYRSFVCAAVEEVGVLVALRREPGAFDDTDLAVTETIARLVATPARELAGPGDRDERAARSVMEEIARVLSHDLPNKVNVAGGHLVAAEETGDPSHFAAVAAALEGIESIADMAVALASSGEPISELDAVDLGETARRTFRPLSTADSRLRVAASATILADPACLSQILENLFRNAIEHTRRGVTIEVGLLEDGFYVADDGAGIAPEIRAHVFDPGVTTAGDHAGAGLPIVAQLADALGWTISLTESASGGARLEIRDVAFA